MISFRYHVVSLVGVLFALAAGIVLGGGPLQSSVAAGTAEPDREAADAARSRVQALEAELAEADALAAAGGARLAEGTLAGRSVTVLALPGTEPEAVAEVASSIESAGGSLAAQLSLGEVLVDVSNRQLVSTLAAQMEESAAGVTIPAGASGYERMGLLLAHAVTTRRDAGRPVTDAGRGILAGLTTAEMVTGTEPERRGSLTVLVTGPPSGSDDFRQGAAAIVASLAGALAAASDGAVVAGPGGEGGLIAALRGGDGAPARVSTVEGLDRAAGVPATVLALAAQAAGVTGHYGSTSAPDGLLPKAGGR